VEAKNQADTLIYQAEKTVKDMNGKGHDDLIKKVQDAIATLKETMKGDDTDKIKADTEALQKPLYELSAELYKQNQGAAQGAAGANAIYCGLGNNFNARRGAHNFTEETFGEACRRAHLAGARVYVTVNIAVATREIPQVLELIRRAWLLGADAFIIQDWGLLAEVRRSWPQIECHVSTQANVHDARGTAWCRELGVARVTLSRELSLDEMRTIAQEGVELEAFGHGALCFCYSGVCMMSSLAGGRSANRGLCRTTWWTRRATQSRPPAARGRSAPRTIALLMTFPSLPTRAWPRSRSRAA
jgi:collagenase-like PrtC family protease